MIICPVFTKLFRLRIKKISVNIDILNVVLDIKCIRLKYMLETIRYNIVGPGI